CDPAFRRFEWVISNRLARSSTPHYTGNDGSQNMDDDAIQYLVDHGINNVISLNQFRLTDDVIGRLKERGINYLHLPVADYTAPTIYQLRQAYDSYFPAQRTTLVYCGYGHGRTGTVIAAFMLLSGNQLTHNEYCKFHVETQEQYDVLDELAKELCEVRDVRDEL
ncbi:10717_t:CDS:2, partial [Funneliformis caledonium]